MPFVTPDNHFATFCSRPQTPPVFPPALRSVSANLPVEYSVALYHPWLVSGFSAKPDNPPEISYWRLVKRTTFHFVPRLVSATLPVGFSFAHSHQRPVSRFSARPDSQPVTF